jgi:putative SOS response-associated peptidase YedK
MCGRYTLRTPLTVLAQQFLFDLGGLPMDILQPRYNICPTQDVFILRRSSSAGTNPGPGLSASRQAALVHWGFIPSWAGDPKIGASMINARGETVAEKPAFRSAFTKRRCLILADGFYEWKKEGKQKIPHYFQMADQRPFAFAGLWECWRGTKEGPLKITTGAIESCTIITTDANELCRPCHDRMPVILSPSDYDLWLDPDAKDKDRLIRLLAPLPAGDMQAHRLNKPVDGSDPLADAARPEGTLF